jgi:hypothetical protein
LGLKESQIARYKDALKLLIEQLRALTFFITPRTVFHERAVVATPPLLVAMAVHMRKLPGQLTVVIKLGNYLNVHAQAGRTRTTYQFF